MLPPGQLLDETEGDDPQVHDELNGVVAPELAGMTEPETDLSHAGGRRTPRQRQLGSANQADAISRELGKPAVLLKDRLQAVVRYTKMT